MPASFAAKGLPPLGLEETLQATAIPPTGRNLGPRVEHIQVAAAGQLSDVVSHALQLPRAFVLELIRFGAVHYCPVMPPPSPKAAPRMSDAHLAHLAQLRAAGKAAHGRNTEKEVPRRQLADVPVHEGGYIRVHCHPKRFPAAWAVDWRQRVLAVTEEYVVVDKPPGVQVPPTCDNVLESVLARTEAALGLAPSSLSNPHRLDVGTSGIVVLARSSGFAAWFSSVLQQPRDGGASRAAVKTYRCLTARPPPRGRMVHMCVTRQRQAGEPAHTYVLPGTHNSGDSSSSSSSSSSDGGSGVHSQDAAGGAAQGSAAPAGAARCELVVLDVEQVALTGSAAQEWGPTAYEATLQLVTGRTHQIRAQMAAVGCPLLGDQLYTALADIWQQQQQQGKQGEQGEQQKQQQQQQQGEQGDRQQQQQQQQPSPPQPPPPGSQPADAAVQGAGASRHRHAGAGWSRFYQTDPNRPIGLQAAKLRIHDGGRMSGARLAPVPGSDAGGPVPEAAAAAAGAAAVAAASAAQADWVEFSAGVPWWRA